jgi:general secretion pathway protein E
VRLNCPHCAAPHKPAADELEASGLTRETVAGWKFRTGRGCGQCRGTGYKGRRAIAEFMLLNDALREMIVARAPIRSLKETARANGTRFLREVAVDLVRAGVTDLKEINRVTFVA